jgi:putative membrane protein
MCRWWDSSVPRYGMFFGPVMMIVSIVITVTIIAWLLHALGLGWRSQWRETPLDTLKHRFARSEIDRAEYEERKKILSGE